MKLCILQVFIALGVLLGGILRFYSISEACTLPLPQPDPSARALKLRGACKGKFRRGRQLKHLKHTVTCRIVLKEGNEPVVFRQNGSEWEPYADVFAQGDKYYLRVEPQSELQTFGVVDNLAPRPLTRSLILIPCGPDEVDNPVFQNCAAAEEAFASELSAERQCGEDSDCGQILYDTGSGCNPGLVVRLQADTTFLHELISYGQLNSCGYYTEITGSGECPDVDEATGLCRCPLIYQIPRCTAGLCDLAE